MNDDELKKLWRQQPLRNPPPVAQLLAAARQQTSQLRGVIDARDLRELVACAVVGLVFGVLYFTVYREPLSRLGVLIIIGGVVFIAWKLIHTRRATPPAPPGATVIEALRAELDAVRAQSRLLKTVLWWYVLPLTIGEIVATWGMRINLHAKITATLFFIAVGAFIYWLNLWARRKQLLPLEAQLESLIHSAETGLPVDEADVAKLRPIVLSIAAADQVKPAEFKVAFWQIALWGEIGFLGIWFFLMLALAMGKEDWPAKPLQPAALSASAEEIHRYSTVARTIVDRLNADEFAAVHDLYNARMTEAFPARATSDFYVRLRERLGDIEKIEGPVGNGHRGWLAFRLRCQRGESMMSLALDRDDRISGIHFRPIPRTSPSMGMLLREIFHWQRLLWIVPFFLGGLLYSRILQKNTERAVGISALEVHVEQGRNLLLWDEIQQVRPLRILNIRSLWLIRESGEKTIMPWSSLERHADLKAAVEAFAPAHHPLREQLSLLKRA